MQALSNQVVLTNSKNNIQLNAMPTESILDPGYFTESTQTHTITSACVHDMPVEITGDCGLTDMISAPHMRRLIS